jgi:hypothetical protein
MHTNEKDVWFRAKKYGWGWGWPCAWQGWVVALAYLGLGVAGMVLLINNQHPGLGIAWMVLASAVFFLICLLKGEKPRWRWGDD